jgi:mono/diheme cytochrome c family protein
MRTRSLFSQLAASLAALAPALAFAGLLASALAGCRSLPPSKPEALWTIEEARGAQVFHQACAKCHYPTTTKGMKGPGLQAITKVKAMPSGTPPTDDRLTYTIVHGRGMMPATQLTEDQLSDLLAYLHSL